MAISPHAQLNDNALAHVPNIVRLARSCVEHCESNSKYTLCLLLVPIISDYHQNESNALVQMASELLSVYALS